MKMTTTAYNPDEHFKAIFGEEVFQQHEEAVKQIKLTEALKGLNEAVLEMEEIMNRNIKQFLTDWKV